MSDTKKTQTGRALHEHARTGDLARVRKLLAAGASPDGSPPDHPLAVALRRGHHEVVEALLEGGASAARAAALGTAVLGHAAMAAPSLIERLVRAGAPVHERCSLLIPRAKGSSPWVIRHSVLRRDLPHTPPTIAIDGGTPLHVAAWFGRTAAIEPLVRAGVRLEARDARGRTALAIGKRQKHAATIDALERAGARWPAPRDPDWRLVDAVEAGDLERLREALAEGAHPDVARVDEEGGATVLCLAAARGDTPMVRLLLDAGARIDLPGWPGGDLSLLERSMNVLVHVGELHDAVIAGADARSLPWRATTALDVALRRGDLELVDVLLARGATSDAALVAAALSGRRDVVARALEAGVGLPGSLAAALLITAACGLTDAAVVLAEMGAPPEVEDIDGLSSLVCAARHGDVALVRALLARGISPATLRKADRATRGPRGKEIRALLDGAMEAVP